MSVDIFICAVEEKKSIDYLMVGIPDPCFDFGDASLVENTDDLFALELEIINEALIDKLLNWPLPRWDDKERYEAEIFFSENKGKYISFYAG
jgi:hypothetical protein